MSLLDHRAPPPDSRPRSKWAGAAAVALIHVVLIGIVMTSMPRTVAIIQNPRDLLRLPPAVASPLPRHIDHCLSRRAPPRFEYAPQIEPKAITVLPPARDLGLAVRVFTGEPCQLRRAQERAHCTNALTMASVQGPPRRPHPARGRPNAGNRHRRPPGGVPCTVSQKPATAWRQCRSVDALAPGTCLTRHFTRPKAPHTRCPHRRSAIPPFRVSDRRSTRGIASFSAR